MENILRKFAIIEENCDTRQQSKVRHPLREVLAFVSTVGHISETTVIKYIEEQKNHD